MPHIIVLKPQERGIDEMVKNEEIEYTSEQLNKAEQIARSLTSVPKEKENLLAIMGKVFVSGMDTGVQIFLEKSNLKK